MNALPFNEMNNWTYEYNQQDMEDRHSLVELIEAASGMTREQSVEAAESYCVFITLMFDVWFKDLEQDDYDLEDMFRYCYENNLVRKEDGYCNYSSADILKSLSRAGYLRPYNLVDVDSKDKGETRQSVYDKLLIRRKEKDFICARVCFGKSRANSHTILVANDDKNRLVVMDTSYRPHEYPGNDFTKWIGPDTILWFTELV